MKNFRLIFPITLILTVLALVSCGEGTDGKGDGTDSTGKTKVAWKIPKMQLTDLELKRLFPKEGFEGYNSSPLTGAMNSIAGDSFYTTRLTLTKGDAASITVELFDYIHAPMSKASSLKSEGWEMHGYVIKESIDAEGGKIKGFRGEDADGNSAICMLVVNDRFSIYVSAKGITDSKECYRLGKMLDLNSMMNSQQK